MSASIRIREAVTDADMDSARVLFREYADSLDFDLDFQNFERELSLLPGPYAPPDGCLLFAETEGAVAGCVALKKLDDEACEMKRLYVRPAYRQYGIGRALSEAIVAEGRQRGYRFMRLDTVEPMHAARALYTSLGFREIEAYCYNPLADAVYMELEL